MERAEAVRKLGKLLGKSLGYRVDTKAATREERDAAKEAITAAVEERNKLREQRDARYRAILEADAEYQNLKTATKLAIERVDNLSGIMRHFKFTVGTSNGMFFHVKAEGDSWEDVIGKLTSEKRS